MPRKGKGLTWRSFKYKQALVVVGITLIILLVSLVFGQNGDLLRTQVGSEVSPSASPKANRTLRVINDERTKGTVTDQAERGAKGDKIDCGTKCEGQFTGGNNVTLYAHPKAGYKVDKWIDIAQCVECANSTESNCTTAIPTVNLRHECKITWKKAASSPTPPPPDDDEDPDPLLTIRNDDKTKGTVTNKADRNHVGRKKINCGTKCSARYAEGSEFSLWAHAKTGFSPVWRSIKNCRACADSTNKQCDFLISPQYDEVTCKVEWQAKPSPSP